MAQLSASTVFGKLKATGEAIVNGVLRAKNGIEVEGGTIDEHATVRAGDGAKNGHLMLEANGGNVYTARDGGDTRIHNGFLKNSLDANDHLIYNVNSLRDNDANCELVFDSSNNRFEFENGSGNRQQILASDVYVGDANTWLDDDHLGVSNAHHSKTTSASDLTDVSADSNLTSSDWGDYEIQKNGTDGAGVINFKTA